MSDQIQSFLDQVNLARYHGQPAGHYESYFLRANHPQRPLAFWIRYTLFSPKDNPGDALGELWAVYFSGETGKQIVAKQEFPLSECRFSTEKFDVRVGQASLDDGRLQGSIHSGQGLFSWDVTLSGGTAPLLLLPVDLYTKKFPAAKSLVSRPQAHFNGTLALSDEQVEIVDWVGSQNHNWGRKHTDLYAWGQVAGFDNHPESFLEVATARLKFGPLWSTPITPLVLRHGGQEYNLNSMRQGMRASSRFGYFDWQFKSVAPQVEIEGTISAPKSAFVGLCYYNPPGGVKHCLNTKIASCKILLRNHVTGLTEEFSTHSRAAFEILTDDTTHGIPLSA